MGNTTILVWSYALDVFVALYRFHDHGGFHIFTTVQKFLKSWWFRVFLRGRLILGEIMILVQFYAFDCFGCFCVTDGNFMDFVIFGDYVALPRFLDFQNLGGLGVS